MDCIADMLYPSILFLHLSYMVYYLHAMLSGRVDPHLAVCNMLLENENHESEMPCGSFQLTKMSINNRVVHTGVYFSHLCANALPCSKITRCPLTVIHHFFCRADQMCFLWRRVWPFALRPPNQNASSVDQKKQAAEQELDATNSGSGFTLWPRATCVSCSAPTGKHLSSSRLWPAWTAWRRWRNESERIESWLLGCYVCA